MLLGSVSNYLVQKSSSPVMVSSNYSNFFAQLFTELVDSYRSLADHSDSPEPSIVVPSNPSTVPLESHPSPTQQSKKNLTLKQSINPKNMQREKELRTIQSKSRRGIGMEMNRIRAKRGGARIAYCIDFFFVFCVRKVLCLPFCFYLFPTQACRKSSN